MKMDRNMNADGSGKYAVINVRKLNELSAPGAYWPAGIQAAIEALEAAGVLEWGAVGDADEFFLIKLKDRYATAALLAYADAIEGDDSEFAAEVREMAMRSGTHHPLCKQPD